MKFGDFVKVKSLSNAQGFKENLERLGLPMPCDEQLESATDMQFTLWKAGMVWPMAARLTTRVDAGVYLADPAPK